MARHRAGAINPALLCFLASALLLAGLIGLLFWDSPGAWRPGGAPLVAYCAGGLKPAIEATANDYTEEFGVEIRLQFGGSQSLLSGAELSGVGDLFLAADDSYIDLARGKGLVDEVVPLAKFAPVLAVPKGNPKKIQRLADLQQPGIRIVQASPELAAIGKVTRDALEKFGKWEAIQARTVATHPTVNDVASALKVGSADAGFVWDATVKQFPDLEAVPLPELAGLLSNLGAGVLRSTKQPTAALHFSRYLAARDKGLLHFAANGYTPVEGDVWADRPTLRLFAGAMLRPAISQTIAAFESREGIRVETVYNGCGILVGQMRTGAEPPDVYFACDQSFMAQVKDLFLEPVAVSTNQLVILVAKENPYGIQSLRDLAKPGLRVGVGHEKQCALGVLTQDTLRQSKTLDAVMKNVKVQTPTGDMLVNQMRTGSLDAVIAYISNATEAASELEAIAIDIPCALATQPLAVGKSSQHKHLAGRLVEAMRSASSRAIFEANGFRWQGAGP